MKMKQGPRNAKGATGSLRRGDKALRGGRAAQQGVTNRPLIEERRQQEKLGSKPADPLDDDAVPTEEIEGTATAQTSAGKTGVRSGTRKRVSANRGGIASGKTRAKSGAHGTSDRRPAQTVRAKRGTTRAA